MFDEQRNSLQTGDDHDRWDFIKQAVAICFYYVLSFKNIIMNNPSGVTICKSKYTVKETIDRLQAVLEQHQVTIYTRINQQQELQKIGQIIPPLEFLLFGNSKAGGPVMAENPVTALDLPLKVIAWQDEQQTVHIAYNDALYIRNRYSLSGNVSATLALDSLISKILL